MPNENQPMLFTELGNRSVVADFSGGHLSSDGGVLLLQQADRGMGLIRMLKDCFSDVRNQDYVEHSLEELLSQRIYGLALGYEDINDHQQLRRDPLMAVAAGKVDPLGLNRINPADRGMALAAPSTLNRLELSNNVDDRYHKLMHDPLRIQNCLIKMGLRCLPKHAAEIILDLDSMGHLLHGTQEGHYFNTYYNGHCYLPLYIVIGDIPLWAQVRTSDQDAACGVVAALEQIVPLIRQRYPKARLIVRGDSGFSREEIMAWCECHQICYVLGLAKNPVLIDLLGPTLLEARIRRCICGAETTRSFSEFMYKTQRTWGVARRVIGKAEVSNQGDNPRFIVTNLPTGNFPEFLHEAPDRFAAGPLYEHLYCARGEMENVLKQQVLDLEADRMSTHYLASNQLRLWLATFAYLLLDRVRTLGCAGTILHRATVGSIRLKLLKVAAQVKISVRRVYIQLCSAYPLQSLFYRCQQRLYYESIAG
jgi:hypothetical protein